MMPATTSAGIVRLEARLKKRLGREFAVDVSFAVEPGITVLFGPSGAGKSTVLQLLAGIADADDGRVVLGGKALLDVGTGAGTEVNVPTAQRNVGYVFQDLALFPHLSALENVEFGLADLPKHERRERATELLRRFRVAETAERRPKNLSGGEQQRVALARTLVRNPSYLLLDEPLSALDAHTKAQILEDLVAWSNENPVPVLYVTHDREEIFSAAKNVLVMDGGKIVSEGAPATALEARRSMLRQRDSGMENVLKARVVARNEQAGTMTCDVAGEIVECVLPHGVVGESVAISVAADDILLATVRPEGISARNLLRGRVKKTWRKDRSVAVEVACGGAVFVAHVTPAAQESLGVVEGKDVWLVFKTHSVQVVRD
jgi:molybdate transport system ATP-binding protein